MTPAALLFDMDGTLLDSDPLHTAVFAQMLAPRGITVDRAYYNAHIHGKLNRDIFGQLLPGSDTRAKSAEKEAAYRALLARAPVPAAPGLLALLDHAGRLDLPVAVVTNACRDNVVAVLDALDLQGRFGAIVSSDDCVHGKPHPEPYLSAAAALGVPAGDCIAFEDSPSGLTSARAAGCYVVGMTTGLDAAGLKAAGADHAIDDFTDPALWQMLGAATGALA